MKNVVIGTIDGEKAEIQKGVDVGEIVVIDGVDKLQNGSKVILPTGDDSHKHGGASSDAASSS